MSQRTLLNHNPHKMQDIAGRIAFTCSKGLTGVGLPRKAQSSATAYGIRTETRTEIGIALGWEDIKSCSVTKTVMDDTLPGGPVERTVEYIAPFDKCAGKRIMRRFGSFLKTGE